MNNYDAMFGYLMKYNTKPVRENFTTYYAYKKGEVKLCNTKLEAMDFCNSNVVLIEENFDDDAYQKALKHYKEQRSKAIDQVVHKMAEDVGYDVGRFAFLYNKVCYEVDFISFDRILHHMILNNVIAIPDDIYQQIIQKYNIVD